MTTSFERWVSRGRTFAYVPDVIGIGPLVVSPDEARWSDNILHRWFTNEPHYWSGSGAVTGRIQDLSSSLQYSDNPTLTDVVFGVDMIASNLSKKVTLAELQKLVDANVFNVRKFGAVGDGVTDDTAAVQAAINATPTYGAVVYFPGGRYLLNSAVTIPARWYLTIKGDSIGPYTDVNNPLTDASNGTVIYCPNAASGFLITRSATTAHRGIRFVDFAMRSTSSYTAVAAFRLNTNGQTTFCRQFTWERVGATYFQYVTLLEDSGASADKAWGVVKFLNCTMQNNKCLVKTNNSTRINHFTFQNNDAGANVDSGLVYRQGAIDITASGVDIADNILEGTNNPIKLDTCDSGIRICNNHLEAATGDWLAYIRHPAKCPIEIRDNLLPTTLDSTLTKGFWIQGNNSSTDAGARDPIATTAMVTPQSVFLTPDNVDRLTQNDLFGVTSTDEINLVTWPDPRWHSKPSVDEVYNTQAYDSTCPSPYGDLARVKSYTILNTTSFKDVLGQLTSWSVGDWIFASYLVRRRDDNTTNPNLKTNFALYFTTGVPTTGGRPLLYSADKATFPGLRMNNRWMFCIHGWRASSTNGSGNNVRCQIIPYNQVNGNFDITAAVFYRCSNPNEFRPWIPWDYMTSGEFALGNKTGATTVDWPTWDTQSLTLTGNATLTFTAPSVAKMIRLRVTQDGTGSRTITWPTINWIGGSAKQPKTTAGSTSFFNFYYDGSAYYETSTNNG